MTKDKSLEHVNYIKLACFCTALIAICALMIFKMIAPSIEAYKASQIIGNTKLINLSKIEQLHANETATLNDLMHDNERILAAIKNGFNEDNFKSLTQQYLKNITLQSTELSGDEQFLAHQLSITGELDSFESLYAYIQALKSFENIVKIDLPVFITKSNDTIKISFSAKIFRAI